MIAVAISEHSFVRVVPGFAKRLDAALSAAGFRAYGRQQIVKQFSGLSLAGVKKMYADDRPPRPRTLDRLLDNLAKALAEVSALDYPVEALKDYVLLDRGDLAIQKNFTEERDTPSAALDEFDIAGFVRKDPVYTSRIIIKIEEVARELGIDTAGRVPHMDVRLIQFRVVSYCHKNRSDVDSPKVHNIVSSLFELAMQGLL